jgi:hypothetical protein
LLVNDEEHVAPHEIPDGDEVIVPLPVTEVERVKEVGVVVCLVAEHDAVVPPLVPAHVQVKLVVPVVTTDAAPVEQRLVVGAVARVWLLEVPHTPAIALGAV